MENYRPYPAFGPANSRIFSERRNAATLQAYMISEIKSVWLMVMFDIPVVSTEEKRQYTRFRKYLLREGFLQLQYSVYAKFCASRENSQKYYNYIKQTVPPEGKVRLIAITDKQFGEMVSLYGTSLNEIEKKPEQLLLF